MALNTSMAINSDAQDFASVVIRFDKGLDLQDDRSHISLMSMRESKKDHILTSGLTVMQSRGYNGTSVKDIVDAARVPKGSFYNYFESKEAFAVDALEKIASETFASSQLILGDTDKSPQQRLQQFFEAGANYAGDCEYKGGCFFGNMCQEMSDSNEAIRTKVQQVLKRKTALLAQVIDEAKTLNEINSDTPSHTIAEFIFNAWEGALMRMKASKSREPLDAFLTILPSILR
ncbi:MAG: TetR/AcrR family transcriptional repressor of nem operon [Lentisphaeria bacterium]|jgi:TetR/AcrR family transcriptional repressor of nem operon